MELWLCYRSSRLAKVQCLGQWCGEVGSRGPYEDVASWPVENQWDFGVFSRLRCQHSGSCESYKWTSWLGFCSEREDFPSVFLAPQREQCDHNRYCTIIFYNLGSHCAVRVFINDELGKRRLNSMQEKQKCQMKNSVLALMLLIDLLRGPGCDLINLSINVDLVHCVENLAC